MDQLGYELPKLSADFASHLHGQVPWYLRNKAKGSGKTKVKPRSQSQPNQKQRLLREPSFYFGDRKSSSGRKSTSAERRSMSEKYLQIGVPMTHLKRPATTSHYSRIESSLSNPVNAIKFHDCQNNHSMTNLRDIRDSVSSLFKPRVSISTPFFLPSFSKKPFPEKLFDLWPKLFFFLSLAESQLQECPFRVCLFLILVQFDRFSSGLNQAIFTKCLLASNQSLIKTLRSWLGKDFTNETIDNAKKMLLPSAVPEYIFRPMKLSSAQEM